MKKPLFMPICLIVINELCGSETDKPKNTGRKGPECLESVMERPVVAKTGFQFATFEAFKDKTVWDTAIAAKDIVPLFASYVVTPANVEATNYETGNFTYQTTQPVKKTTYESYLGFCSHAALASYGGSEYTQVFEFNIDGSIVGVNNEDGSVKGQDLQKLDVGIRTVATNEKPAFSIVTLTYKNYKQLEQNAAVIKPTWASEIQGIFDLNLVQVSATATTIKFKAFTDCGKRSVNSLVSANVVVKNASGTVVTTSFVAADSDGVYTLTGTGFATGFTVSIDGVITQGGVMYEGEAPLSITVTP